LRGEFETTRAIFLPASLFSKGEVETRHTQGTFEGTMEDGQWTRFVYSVPLGPDATREDRDKTNAIALRPLVGRMDTSIISRHPDDIPPALISTEDEDKDGASEDSAESADVEPREPSNLLRASVEEWWDSSVSTSYMRWDENRNGAELVMEVPVDDSRRAPMVTMTAFFPGGGQHATNVDTILPRRLVIGDGLFKAKAMNGQLHLQGVEMGNWLLPLSESWGAVIGFFGFTGGVEQRLAYTSAQQCS